MMFRSLLIVLLFAFIFSFDVAVCNPVPIPCSYSAMICGKPSVDPIIHRIVGGQEARDGAWPWTVMLVNGNRVVCGGAILSERLIMTAAHCFDGNGNDPKNWRVVAGRHNIQKPSRNEMILGVSSIKIHNGFDNNTLGNDIAILALDKPFLFSASIGPICLPPSSQEVTRGQQCVLAGWGETRGYSYNVLLNQVVLPVIGDDVCAQNDWYGVDFDPKTTFCAGYSQGGKDACRGDSGGPLVCKTGKRWFVQGIASWGYDCAQPKWPGIYTEVTKFIPWIQKTISDLGHCNSPIIG